MPVRRGCTEKAGTWKAPMQIPSLRNQWLCTAPGASQSKHTWDIPAGLAVGFGKKAPAPRFAAGELRQGNQEYRPQTPPRPAGLTAGVLFRGQHRPWKIQADDFKVTKQQLMFPEYAGLQRSGNSRNSGSCPFRGGDEMRGFMQREGQGGIRICSTGGEVLLPF